MVDVDKNFIENEETEVSLKERILWGVALVLVALASSAPLFYSHILIGHDIYFFLSRIEGIKEALLGGQFPARIEGFNFNGYGIPTGFFYPSVFLYIPAFLRIFGVSLIDSYNAYCFFINFLTAIIAWWIFTQLSKSIRIGAIGACFYVGFFYRLVDLYLRSAMGEAMAMAFMPLAIGAIWLLIYRSSKYWIAVVIGCSGVLSSHIISVLFLVVAIFLVLLVSYKKLLNKAILIALFKAFIFTLLINLWFYAPFVDMYLSYDFPIKHDVDSNPTKMTESILPFSMMTAFCFGSGFMFCFLIICLCLWGAVEKYRNNLKISSFKNCLITFFIGSIFIIVSMDIFPWDIIRKLPTIYEKISVIQFPWRSLVWTAIFFSYGGAMLFYDTMKNRVYSPYAHILLTLIISSVIVFSNLCYLYMPKEEKTITVRLAEEVFHGKDVAVINQMNNDSKVIWGYVDYIPTGAVVFDVYRGDEFDPDDLTRVFTETPDKIFPEDNVLNYEKKGVSVKFSVDIKEPIIFTLPLWYYSGYEAKNEAGEVIPVFSGNEKRLSMELSAGKHNIEVNYKGRSAHRHAFWISVISLFIFITLIYRERKKVMEYFNENRKFNI